jgi:hypothetical protein
MLPILRILPVGGVLLAILVLVLALKPPEPRALPPNVMAARGPLIDRDGHPEWRQFLIQAALRRADELNRLRELMDTLPPALPLVPEIDAEADGAAEGTTTTIAGLPVTRDGSEPEADEVTGTASAAPAPAIPVDIGATSSFELPLTQPEAQSPVIRTPEHARPAHNSEVKPAHQSHAKPVRKVRRAKVKKPEPAQAFHLPPPFNLLEQLFAGDKSQPKTGGKAAPKSEPPQARASLD